MKHKHYNLIVAWANGAKIEVRELGCDEHGEDWYPWKLDVNPHWCIRSNYQYRIKPEPKPDRIVCRSLGYNISTDNLWASPYLKPYSTEVKSHLAEANIKLVFDGETNKLKSVEALS